MLRWCPCCVVYAMCGGVGAMSMFSVNNEEGFYKAKSVDLQSKIHYAQFDILDLASSDYKDERDFDMVFFSNILYSLPLEENLIFIHMLESEFSKLFSLYGWIATPFRI